VPRFCGHLSCPLCASVGLCGPLMPYVGSTIDHPLAKVWDPLWLYKGPHIAKSGLPSFLFVPRFRGHLSGSLCAPVCLCCLMWVPNRHHHGKGLGSFVVVQGIPHGKVWAPFFPFCASIMWASIRLHVCICGPLLPYVGSTIDHSPDKGLDSLWLCKGPVYTQKRVCVQNV
jgi:hypothetical protein